MTQTGGVAPCRRTRRNSGSGRGSGRGSSGNSGSSGRGSSGSNDRRRIRRSRRRGTDGTLGLANFAPDGWRMEYFLEHAHMPQGHPNDKIKFIHNFGLKQNEVWSMEIGPEKIPWGLNIGFVSEGIEFDTIKSVEQSLPDFQSIVLLTGEPAHRSPRRIQRPPRQNMNGKPIKVQVKIDNSKVPMVRYHNMEKEEEWSDWRQFSEPVNRLTGVSINNRVGAPAMRGNNWRPYITMKASDFKQWDGATIDTFIQPLTAHLAGNPHIKSQQISGHAAQRERSQRAPRSY